MNTFEYNSNNIKIQNENINKSEDIFLENINKDIELNSLENINKDIESNSIENINKSLENINKSLNEFHNDMIKFTDKIDDNIDSLRYYNIAIKISFEN